METSQNRFERVAKILLYVLAAALPIWFIPWRFDVEFGREMTFWALAILAAILWLLGSLTRNEIRFRHSPLLWAGAALLAIFSLVTIFSKAPLLSALFADPVGERLSTLFLGVLLMILAGSFFRSAEDAEKPVFLLLAVGWLAGIINILQIFGYSPYQLPFIGNWLPFLRGIDFNVIGTTNALSLFYAALFMISMGALLGRGGRSLGGQFLLAAGGFIFLINIFLINFWGSWMILLATSIILFGLLFREGRGARADGTFGWRHWILLALLIFSVVMMMVRAPLLGVVGLPNEVSPSQAATLKVAWFTWGEGAKSLFLGSGPGTFGIDWARYKDTAINGTPFWGIRFNQGSSWFTTLLSTTGLLGFLATLGFFAIIFWTFLRKIFLLGGGEIYSVAGIFSGAAALIFAALIYPANFSLIILLFFLAGLLSVILSNKDEETSRGRFFSWDTAEKNIKFQTPAATFISSLVIVFCISLGVAGLYLVRGRVRAAWAAQSGAVSLGRGAVDEAISEMEIAMSEDPNNFRYSQMLLQAREEKIRGLIQRATKGENVGQEFQLATTQAIQDSQRLVELSPEDSSLRRAQGGLYELLIPFINGSERFASASYEKAADLEPTNPAIYTEWGRATLTFSDRLQFLEGQSSGDNKDQIKAAKKTALEETQRVLQRAVTVKPDYAPAHFLLAQTALRLGNTAAAIQSVEAAKLSAPFDIGVAFQLGLLYYQNGDLARAEAEFLRAVSINANYSNAHYFLGLIYDRRGQKEKALNEFEKVLSFNPDNEEVQKILANLRKGKSALSGISPPGTPPEKRKETPVK